MPQPSLREILEQFDTQLELTGVNITPISGYVAAVGWGVWGIFTAMAITLSNTAVWVTYGAAILLLNVHWILDARKFV